MHARTHIRARTRARTYIYTHTHAHTHAHARTHRHTHTHFPLMRAFARAFVFPSRCSYDQDVHVVHTLRLPRHPFWLPSTLPLHLTIPCCTLQAAMIAGLISRFIFISPSWDKGDNTTYSRAAIEIGSMTPNNTKEPTFCCCMFVPSEGKRQCAYFPPSSDVVMSDTLDACKVGW